MAYAVVRTDLLAGTDVRADLVSFKYFDGEDNGAEIENGNVVKLDGLMEGERELYKAVDPTADTGINDIVLVAGVEMDYDERIRNLDQFINKAGAPVRGYRFRSGNIFSVTAEAFNGDTAPAVGDPVKVGAGTKLFLSGDGTEIGTVIEVATAGRYTYYAIKVA